MYEFTVRSSRGSDSLKLWAVKPGELWRVRVDFDHLEVEAKVYERHSGSELRLDKYFGELADEWKGWNGAKRWESLGLDLAARHDGRGHITLDATLQDDYASGDRWRVRASLELEAGGLDALARAASTLDRL